MSQDLPWWNPAYFAVTAIVDLLEPEQQAKVIERWRAMAACQEDKGDLMAAYFLHELAGEEMPMLKSKSSHLKVVK